MSKSSDSLPVGWYEGPDGNRRYWDGVEWKSPDAALDSASAANSKDSTDEPELLDGLSLLKSRSRRTKIIAATVAGVVVVGSIAGAVVFGLLETQEREAESLCRVEIVDRLKSPATAELSEVQVLTEIEYMKKLSKDLNAALADLGVESDDDAENSAAFELALREIDEKNRAGEISLWYVVGVVDSQNGFGATVRNEWACDVKYEHNVLVDGPNANFLND